MGTGRFAVCVAVAVAVAVAGGCGRKSSGTTKLNGEMLVDGWEAGQIATSSTQWEAWDKTQSAQSTTVFFTEGERGYRLDYDFEKCAWPMVWRNTETALNLTAVNFLAVDVYVPPETGSGLSMTMALSGFGLSKMNTPKSVLHEGWNTVVAELDGPWLDADTRRACIHLEMVVAPGVSGRRGWVVFDNLRTGVK